jgi:hypothetical protein
MRGNRWIGVAALAAVVVGCGSTGPTSTAPKSLGPTVLQRTTSPPAAGTHRVTCKVDSDHGRVDLALDLPRGFVRGLPAEYGKDHHCSWHHPVRVPDDSNFDGDPSTADTFASNVVITVRSVHEDGSLEDVYDDLKPDAVDGDDPEGDDSILHLERSEDVKAFGDTVGDRLSFLCFCDGQNLISRYAQADGILLEWKSEEPLQKETDRQLEAVLASVGKVTRQS